MHAVLVMVVMLADRPLLRQAQAPGKQQADAQHQGNETLHGDNFFA
jgi:hypothetical protein